MNVFFIPRLKNILSRHDHLQICTTTILLYFYIKCIELEESGIIKG